MQKQVSELKIVKLSMQIANGVVLWSNKGQFIWFEFLVHRRNFAM